MRLVNTIRVGKTVTHTQEPALGTGRVVALRRGANVALVIWQDGVQRQHDLRVIQLAKNA